MIQFNITDEEPNRDWLIHQSWKLWHLVDGKHRPPFTDLFPLFNYKAMTNPSSQNRSTNSLVLIYSAVPKTGSTTIGFILQTISMFQPLKLVGNKNIPMAEDKFSNLKVIFIKSPFQIFPFYELQCQEVTV